MIVRFPIAFIALTLFAGSTAFAQDVVRLSPDEREQAIESRHNAQIDPVEAQYLQPDGKIHGEVGVMIGTGGARGAYGVAAIPLGENAGAVVAFESQRFPTQRWRRR